MKIQKTKKLSTAILMLVLTFAALLTCLPSVSATDIPSYVFLSVVPDPIGVGQSLTVVMWLSAVPPTASGASGDRWKDLTLTITKPDATTQSLGPYEADPVASYYLMYTPDQVGTYTFQVSFPGQHIVGTDSITGLPIDNTYKPATSPKVAVTVQQTQIQRVPDVPLPTDYWDRPINPENQIWWSISGNWLQGWYSPISGRFNPYTKAPNTAHVVWKKPVTFGGLIGGEFGDIDYYTGMSYEPTWDPPVIIGGKLYYNQRLGSSSWDGLACVDLRTGEQIWYKNGTTITMGQIYDYESPNQHGAIPYLWQASGTTWSMYDAFTGNWILNLANAVPIGPFANFVVYSKAGDMLVYMLGANSLAMWNSSKVSGWLAGSSGPNAWSWRPPQGKTLNWQTGIQWNVTVPSVPGQTIARITPDVIIASVTTDTTLNTYKHMGYSTKTGERLWIQDRTNLPVGFTTTNLGGSFASGIGPTGEGVYTIFTMATMQWWGYDISTGNQLWGPTEAYTNAWGMYAWGLGNPAIIAYGKLYAATFDGMVHCYDVKTGTHLWDYSAGSSGFETPYGVWPFAGGVTVADGKIFAATSEHSPNTPLYRGEKLHVVNAETGKLVWSILGWYNQPGLGAGPISGPAVADGYLVAVNAGDNQIYCFGKGKTTTAVTASPKIAAKGSEVLIEGTVMDQSPAQANTPAIADASMTAWMQYLNMQQPKPTDAVGVSVHLTAIGPSGNTEDLGVVVSDSSGMFKKMWTPTNTGEYTIKASFDGSESYWSSSSETALGVSTTTSATASPTATANPAVNAVPAEIFYAVAAILAILMIVVIILLVRKR